MHPLQGGAQSESSSVDDEERNEGDGTGGGRFEQASGKGFTIKARRRTMVGDALFRQEMAKEYDEVQHHGQQEQTMTGMDAVQVLQGMFENNDYTGWFKYQPTRDDGSIYVIPSYVPPPCTPGKDSEKVCGPAQVTKLHCIRKGTFSKTYYCGRSLGLEGDSCGNSGLPSDCDGGLRCELVDKTWGSYITSVFKKLPKVCVPDTRKKTINASKKNRQGLNM